jgi:hypothetical protein
VLMPSDPVKLREAGRRAAELAWQSVDETPIELEDPLAPHFAVSPGAAGDEGVTPRWAGKP